jgi:hypothetical protein
MYTSNNMKIDFPITFIFPNASHDPIKTMPLMNLCYTDEMKG